MKKFSKILSVALLVALVLSLGVANAFADVTISVERDNTFDEDATGTGRVYTYYQAFRADYNGTHTDSTGTAEHGYDANGDPITQLTSSGTADAFSYYLLTSSDSTQISALRGAGNEWFTLTDSADGSRVNISWKNGVATDADTIQAAAKWLKANCVLATGTLAFADGVWSKTVSEGYYVIEGSEGANLVAATTNINIKEKNSYPTINKEQKKAADPDYTEAKIPQEIGKYIDYKVTVHVPNDANKQIAVVDKMSAGLDFDETFGTNGLTVTPAAATYTALTNADNGYLADATWQIKFSDEIVKALQGQDIVITYRALVTTAALTDEVRDNEVTLNYNEGHYILPDKVEYTTYFTGILKVDGKDKTTPLSGVKFDLFEQTTATVDEKETVTKTEVKVKWDETNKYYVVDPTGTNHVVTGTDGKIIIRGLDGQKTYVLTETETKTGYNLLDGDKTLRLVEDKGTAYTTEEFDKVENNSGTVLPSTGGIGTTIFYVVGGVLVLAAIILLVTKKRMSE